jgi:nucleoside-diphosphate-sugar epimerase
MIVITGGAGLLARALLAALPDTPLRLQSLGDVSGLDPRVEVRVGDLRDEAFVGELLAGAAAVVHLAPIVPQTEDDVAAIDHATRGTYHLALAAQAAGVRKIVLGSSMELFARLPASWRVTEGWRPRPTPSTPDLCAWLAECAARELARETGVPTICLRLGRIVGGAGLTEELPGPRCLHVEDAVEGVCRALAYEGSGWSIFHLLPPGPRAAASLAARELGYRPRRELPVARGDTSPIAQDGGPWQQVLTAPEPLASRTIQRVTIFGAGGPIASTAAQELAPHYTLRLTDIQPLAEIVARGEPQSPYAPLPVLLGPPHSEAVVDVSDWAQVAAACEGADALVNCTVLRHDPVKAFRVNVLGAYNVMRAAAAAGIRRVVHTGPFMVSPSGITSYAWDYEVREDAPPRPGGPHHFQLYFHTKYLGQEICRVFAEHYGMEVPALLFCGFVSADAPAGGDIFSFTLSFQDAGRAIHRALAVPALPAPYEVLHINANLPHGVFPNDKARRVLGWEPRDDLRAWWEEGEA